MPGTCWGWTHSRNWGSGTDPAFLVCVLASWVLHLNPLSSVLGQTRCLLPGSSPGVEAALKQLGSLVHPMSCGVASLS